jgi:hypothetical protein
MRNIPFATALSLSAMALALVTPGYLRGAGDEAKGTDDAKDKSQIPPILRSLTMKDDAVDDIADALGIKKRSGAFELRREARGARLVLDFYQGGKCVQTCSTNAGSLKATSQGEFSIQIVDLDYLPLGGAKPGHLRLRVKLKFAGSTGSTQKDIAKDKIGFGNQQATARFEPTDGTPRDAPLYFTLYTESDAKSMIINSGTPAEQVKQHPHASLLIVRLVFEDNDFKDVARP